MSKDCSPPATSASSSVTRACTPPRLSAHARAGALDEDLAHRVGGNGAEVRAILPAVRPVLHQAQVRLVDETGRLQRLPGTLAAQVVGREPPQFLIDDRQQRVERLPVVGHAYATRSIVTLFMTTGVTGRS